MKPTNDVGQQATALLFVSNLETDRALGAAWAALLTRIDQALQQAGGPGPKRDAVYQQAIQAADNFLVDQGYDTTADAVLSLLQSPFYAEHLKESEPNAASDAFVQKLLTDATVFKGWNGLLTTVAAGTADVSALDQYLTDNHFACSYQQVSASFVKMRNHQLSYWSGTYDTQLQEVTDGTPSTQSSPGPTLVIYGAGTVCLAGAEGSDTLSASMTYSNGKLTWQKDLLGTYSGDIQFSLITTAAKAGGYTGPLFSGTLLKPTDGGFDPFGKPGKGAGKTYQVQGELAAKPKYADNIPANVSPSEMDKILRWVNYAIIGFMILKTVISMGKKYRNTKDFAAASEDVYGDQLSSAEAEAKSLEGGIAADGSSPFADLDFSDSNVLQDLRGQLAAEEQLGDREAASALKRQIADETKTEDDFDDVPDDAASLEGEGWGRDLSNVLRDA